jgi:hypothetical protein
MDQLKNSRKTSIRGPRVFGACCKRTLVLGCLILFSGSACSREKNTPQEVAEQFLAAVTEGSRSAIDTLVAWDKVLLAEGYITWSIFNGYSPEEKAREITRYKEKFFEQDLPLIRLSNCRISSKRGVVVNRDDSDVFVKVVFTANEKTKKQGREFETSLELKFYPSTQKWFITNFGDLVRINMIKGDFDPDRFYLDRPVQ